MSNIIQFPDQAHETKVVSAEGAGRADGMGFQKLTPDLLFADAFKIWIKRRVVPEGPRPPKIRYLSKKTIRDYTNNSIALGKYFDDMQLGAIDSGHLTKYQNARASCDHSVAKWAHPAGANCIVKEISLMLRILREAGVWGEEQEEELVRVQREKLDIPRALSADEQEHFLRVAASRIEFHFMYWYSLLALDSTCSAGEMRCLKLGDISLDNGIVIVRRASAKNKYRMRTIALLDDITIWALRMLIDRARELGATAPYHCLFPIRDDDGNYDPTRPMSEWGLKKRFDAVKDEAGPSWFKPNGFRHTGLTRLAEGGTPIHVLLARAGHIDETTQGYYIQISIAAQRRHAKKLIAEKPPTPSKKPPMRQAAAPKKRANGPFWISSTTSY